MAWENRNGRHYYYRKRRVGQRVVSEYLGAGEFVALLARMEEIDREQERAKRRARLRELAQWREIDGAVDQALDLGSELVSAVLLVSGFHTHKGQWRRLRERR